MQQTYLFGPVAEIMYYYDKILLFFCYTSDIPTIKMKNYITLKDHLEMLGIEYGLLRQSVSVELYTNRKHVCLPFLRKFSS